MPKYSVKQLESLVQEGKFKKKEIKVTYTSEFLSRTWNCLKTGGIIGSILGIGLGLLGATIPNESKAIEMGLTGFLGFGGLTTALTAGTIGFYNWKENAKPYINAGGKVLYQEKGLKLNKHKFILPSNYNDSNKELEFNIPFQGYFDF